MVREFMSDARFGGLRTNLVKNPSMEASTSTAVIRTNSATHGSGAAFVTATGTSLGFSNAARWGTGGAGTYSVITEPTNTPTPGITTYLRKTWTTAPSAAGDTGFETNAWTIPLAGYTYTISAWIRLSAAHTLVGWDVLFTDAIGLVGRINSATQAVQANLWTRISASFVVPYVIPIDTTQAKFILEVDGGIPAVGEKIEVTGLLLEPGGGYGGVLRRNLHEWPQVGRSSTGWAAVGGGATVTATRQPTGGPSLPGTTPWWYRVDASSANTSTPVGIDANAIASGHDHKVYVLEGDSLNLSAYYISSMTAQVRLVWTWTRSDGTIHSTVNGSLVTPTANTWLRLSSGTVVAPTGLGSGYVSVSVRTSATVGQFTTGQYMGLTAVLAEPSETLGTYFDGSTAGTDLVQYTWDGVAYQAGSTQSTPPQALVQPYFDGATRPPIRVNYHQNPRATVAGGATWAFIPGTTGAATTSFVSAAVDGPVGIPTYHRVLATTAKTGGVDGIYTRDTTTATAPVLVAEPGETVSVGMWVRLSHALPVTLQVAARYNNAAVSGAVASATPVTVEPGTWSWLTASIVAPASPIDDVQIWAQLDSSSILPVGGTFDATGALIEEAPAAGVYFDGAITPPTGYGAAWYGTANSTASYLYDTDLAVRWVGTAFASVSEETASGVDTYVTGPDSSTKIMRSAHWSKSRSYSLRVRSEAVDEVYLFTVYATPFGLGPAYIDEGKTYTATATLRIAEPLSGALSPDRLTLKVIDNSGTQLAISELPPNEPGVYQLRVTWVAADSNQVCLLHGGMRGSGDVWWDDLLVEEVDVRRLLERGYFDGSFPNARWTGTPDATISEGLGFAGMVKAD